MEGRSWLGFGPRTPRTPQVVRAATPNLITTQSDMGACPAQATEDRSLQHSLTQIHIQPTAQKTARLSRISSFIGLGSVAKAHATTATSSPYPEQIMERSESMSSPRTTSYHDVPYYPAAGIWHARVDNESDFVYKESDQTWHNPNLMQMMDTVSSTIMSNGISEPIPRHLNSFVIGMVEEFRTRLGKQSALEAQFENLRNTRKKEIQEFAGMADEWKIREAEFKAEVKRLEQIIAGQDGMHSVVIARAGSMYNRSDIRAFQAKLNRLSKSEEEVGSPNSQQIIMEGEMRNFAVVPDIKDSSREIVLDHNTDAFLSELYRPDVNLAGKRMTSPDCLGQRTAAAQRFMDGNGRPRLPSNNESNTLSPRKSDSTATSSSAASSTSSSLIAQGLLASRAEQGHITPHTTPPRPEPVKPYVNDNPIRTRTGHNAMQTIQELMRINGGLPEDAVDDESSYTPSCVTPHHIRAESFDFGHDKSAAQNAIVAVVESSCENVGLNGAERPQALAPCETAPPPQFDSCVGHFPRQSSTQSLRINHRFSISPDSQTSSRSATLVAMAHNCIDHAGQSGGSDCPRNSPMRKVQSGADPFPDPATRHRFRIARTVLNANIREHSYMTNQELREVMDDRTCQPQKTQAIPSKLAHNSAVPRPAGVPIACPPGFETHDAAGLLPFQQAAAQRAANRMNTVKQAATERNEAIQGHAKALEQKLNVATWQSVDENDEAN